MATECLQEQLAKLKYRLEDRRVVSVVPFACLLIHDFTRPIRSQAAANMPQLLAEDSRGLNERKKAAEE